MSHLRFAMLTASLLALALSCDETVTAPALTGTLPVGPVCGNAVRDEGETCDPYAPRDTWSCPGQRCTADCTCTDDMGTGGDGGMGGMGGTGGMEIIDPKLPIGGNGVINCDAPSGAPGTLELTVITSGFDLPVLAVAPPGALGRIYVVEQRGRVMLYENGEKSVFLDVSARVDCCGEQGLLGLAFHPDYLSNGRFFIHHSDLATGGDTVLAEYARDPANHDVALPDPVGAPLLTQAQPAGNHNGGSIEISPSDGHLYITLGDGGGANDTFGNGQNLATRLGGVLRFDISVTPAVAAGNYPGGDTYLWDVGLRNPWRASFDRCNGDLYIGDVGQYNTEEVNVEPSGSGHLNFGWNTMEGPDCFSPSSGCDTTGLTLPATSYPQEPECAVTGGYVYRGSAIPWLRGTYFYGDYCTGRMWSFVWDGSSATSLTDRSAELDSLGNIRLSSFGQDASGEVYVLDYQYGTLYRVENE